MPSIGDLGSIFNTIREVDLTPIREAAELQTWIAIIGTDASGARDLATAFYLAPRPLPGSDASYDMAGPILVTAEDADMAEHADLMVFVFGVEQVPSAVERELFQRWAVERRKIIVVFNQPVSNTPVGRHEWAGARVLEGQVVSRDFLEKHFVPSVLALLPDNKLSIARNFPLFRSGVARDVIGETSIANASYSFSTGLAEIVPVLNIPFNVADMVILTKAQAFMVYRLGLIFGLSTHWRDHLAAFGSTVGFGFVWRTLARQLVGLIPALGILPKVAISYAGTYAMGRGALQWYETGRDVKPADIEHFFREALERGKQLASSLAERAPKVQAPKLSAPKFSMPQLPFRKKKELTAPVLPDEGRMTDDEGMTDDER